MQRKGRTIYQTARLYADLTQESASEILNISCKSIGAYERGETIPPDEIVIAMVELYNAPWLSYMHLKPIIQ
jgi:DNA-binding XRE family transcriptional regulator